MASPSFLRTLTAASLTACAFAAFTYACSSDDPIVTPTPDASPDVAVVEAGVDAPIDSGPPCAPFVLPPSCTGDGGVPDELACTGLYSDFATRAVACDIREFKPGFTLWTDGALKRRFILLPPNSKIDVTNVDEWVFPLGTKLWKEFTIQLGDGGTQVAETRFFWKAPDKDIPEGVWRWTTYVWSADGKTATKNDVGVKNVAGTTYEVPSHAQCIQCHGGRQDDVLGFEALLLAAPEATGVSYGELLSSGRLTSTASGGPPPANALQIPGNPTERPALGYLHVNCGVACHNATAASPANLSGFHMKLKAAALGSPTATDTVVKGANKKPGNNWPGQPTAPDGGWYDIHPGDVGRSLVVARISTRDPLDGGGVAQMPPIGTHVVDDAGVTVVKKWIGEMTTDGGYPAPAP